MGKLKYLTFFYSVYPLNNNPLNFVVFLLISISIEKLTKVQAYYTFKQFLG